MLRDENRQVFTALDSFSVEKAEPGVFVGGTENARGDHDGTSDPTTLFTVTGDVIVRVYGVCTVSLVGNTATIEVGVDGNTAELLAQSTATDIDANDIWVDATVDDVKAATFEDIVNATLITNGSDIIETIATANITAGNIYYVCLWRPVTPGSSVVAV